MSSHAPKVLEVKIRPYQSQSQDRPDHKHTSRVYVCTDILLDLQLKSGETCYLWKISEGEHTRREAVIWLAAEKLSRKVVQVSKALQEACGFRLSDEVCIARGGELATAQEVKVKDVGATEGDIGELRGRDQECWEWVLEDCFARAETIFPGMTFKDVLVRREKRTFTVHSVNGSRSSVAKYNEVSSIKITSAAALSGGATPTAIIEQKSLQLVDIAGIDQALGELNNFLSDFNRHFKFTKARRSPAVLLHGGRGTGKTFIVDKITNTAWGKVRKITRTTKPAEIQKTFKEAKLAQPSIIVIDDMDAIVTKDGTILQDVTEAICEGVEELTKDQPPTSLPRVLVVATTSDIGKIPMSLRKRGRFATDIMLPIPDAAARKAILKSSAPQISPETSDQILDDLGERTHAYTPEDLALLLDQAHITAEKRLEKSEQEFSTPENFVIQEDIEHALLVVRPSAMHDITLRPPKVRWHEIGGQDKVKEAIQLALETPFRDFGGSPTKGLLLYGPPGCSKTLTAQAVATEMGFNFFAVKGAEVLSKYVGDSERAVRNIFARARAAAPSIIFFDEIESIGGKRDSKNTNSGVNVLTTLLNEMDGIESLKGVTVLAATNKPQDLDLALLRPGRFDELIYVAPPDLSGREEILRVRQRKTKMADDVDIPELARLTEGYSGAELVSICSKAISAAIKRCIKTGQREPANMEDFLGAIKSVKKQITPEVIGEFERWAARARGDSD
ncbi:hypothetical protein CJF32_00008446 [Rutstroemia sp. NJR-2017a WRK4]|nr:hypothetical protein CJF32_00008446 [Rutstroemia sp. NJR-2017a WRK4]